MLIGYLVSAWPSHSDEFSKGYWLICLFSDLKGDYKKSIDTCYENVI